MNHPWPMSRDEAKMLCEQMHTFFPYTELLCAVVVRQGGFYRQCGRISGWGVSDLYCKNHAQKMNESLAKEGT